MRHTFVRHMSDVYADTGSKPMQRVTIRLPEQQLKMIDIMVDQGEFPSASEAIRAAIRDLIDRRSDNLIRNMQIIERIRTTPTA